MLAVSLAKKIEFGCDKNAASSVKKMCMYTIVSFSEGKNYRLLPIVAGIRQRIQRAVRDTSQKVKVKVQ